MGGSTPITVRAANLEFACIGTRSHVNGDVRCGLKRRQKRDTEFVRLGARSGHFPLVLLVRGFLLLLSGAGYPIAPTTYKAIPARLHARSVGIIPTLNRKIATAATTAIARAQGSTVSSLGASKANNVVLMGIVSRKSVCTANQMARLSTTPTTAAVIAVRAALRAFTPLSLSANGAPRKIQRKHGVEGHPSGEQSPERPCQQRRKLPRVSERPP